MEKPVKPNEFIPQHQQQMVIDKTQDFDPTKFDPSTLEYPDLAELFVKPSDYVELPSRGKLYKNHKTHVMIEYMTTKDEDILSSPNLVNKAVQFDVLVEKKMKDKDIKVKDLLIGDYEVILLFLRMTGLGDDYEVKVTDPNDGYTFKTTIQLSNLNIKYLHENPDSEGLFDFTLPVSGIEVKFKLLTKNDEMILERMLENDRKKGDNNFNGVTKALGYQIQKFRHPSVDKWFDKSNKDAIYFNKFIENMKRVDSFAFREHLSKITPGIDMSYRFENPKTGRPFRAAVPLGLEFFYPDTRSTFDTDETDSADGEIW